VFLGHEEIKRKTAAFGKFLEAGIETGGVGPGREETKTRDRMSIRFY
jgi:hypothetical protein